MELRAKTKTDIRHIGDLTRERATLLQKVKDRDDELKGKARFLEVWDTGLLALTDRAHVSQDVQDEVIALNLQLNMSEQTVKKLKVENKDLIDRWMAHKGREADEMNEALG